MPRIARPYQNIQKPPFGQAFLDRSDPINDGLVGFWLLNEDGGVTAYDLSGNNNHGTLVNNPAWVGGENGGAFSLDGVNDYLSLPQSSLYVGTTWTISAAVYLRTLPSDYAGLFIISDSTSWSRYLRISPTGAIEGGYFRTGVGEVKATTGTLITQTYNSVAYTCDGSNTYAWLNGIPGSATAVATPISTTQRVTSVGGNWADNATFWPCDGIVDVVRYYNRALSADQLQRLRSEPLAGLRKRAQILDFDVPAAGGFKPAWAIRSNQIIGGGSK
jgi:hypothetical protein